MGGHGCDRWWWWVLPSNRGPQGAALSPPLSVSVIVFILIYWAHLCSFEYFPTSPSRLRLRLLLLWYFSQSIIFAKMTISPFPATLRVGSEKIFSMWKCELERLSSESSTLLLCVSLQYYILFAEASNGWGGVGKQAWLPLMIDVGTAYTYIYFVYLYEEYSFFFFFTSRNILESVETQFETNMRSGRDL